MEYQRFNDRLHRQGESRPVMNYQEFLESKSFRHVEAGFICDQLNESLFDYQIPIVKWALKRGKAAIFADTGLGKTIMQLEWAIQVYKHTKKPVLILAPLAVSNQTIIEGEKYGIPVFRADPDIVVDGVQITNYEQLHKYDASYFSGIVIDESSILKGMNGSRRKEITEFARSIPYRLSCTATPSPNDFMEIGTQSEFLGIMSQVEMLAMFFIHDGSDTSKWRLKGHGQAKFFEWMASWSVVIRSPSDLGFDGSNHKLKPIVYHSHVIETDPINSLIVEPAQGLQDRNKARKSSVDERVQKAADIANSMTGQVLVWCNLNEESEKLTSLINDAVEVKGADKPEHKELAAKWFVYDNVLVLNGKLTEKDKCLGNQNMQKLEERNISQIKSIEKKEFLNQEIANQENNICENMQSKIDQNSVERQISRQSTTSAAVNDTQMTKSTEIEKNQKSPNTKRKTLICDSKIDSNNTELHQTNTGLCVNSREGDARCVDHSILDAQRKSDSTSITATQQAQLEDCFASTAIKVSGNLKTARSCLEKQPNTSKKVLISKPRIFGYGLNFQNCNQMIFVGLSDSWESYYQAIRRCWRFGQKNDVHVHVISADTEGAVIENIQRKDKQNNELGAMMINHMKTAMDKEIFNASTTKTEYNPVMKMEIAKWLK